MKQNRQTEDGMPKKVFDVIYVTPSYLDKDIVSALGEKLVENPYMGVSRLRVATNYDEAADFLEDDSDGLLVLISSLDVPGYDGAISEVWPLMIASMNKGGYSVVNEGIPQPKRNGFADHHVLKSFHGIRSPEAFYNTYLAPLREKASTGDTQSEAAG